ncbi:MAG: minichromosome maintenance protein MCM [Candidatus Nanoarchaeia archaeon]|nr:minichromosome maintenance protein MCM [Candidatus Haiyanarchaeum thermophilum]MCW1303146.1 minichromosome maintenance protein MCM [Candidatus Haiyanarchaeum thermophilum]MCW1303811.1 minichromosome maintenance protein MCM [Candidatus Haiyanarchaeum thermophilum]MCW1306986.1 minichromosome maintenance protein MCM [Candidatus Haiyanarchaeum thermophilum]MCW1307657.1 minichromosome maintenance protein MCM [Candidatus Haiyanarchaeum thermophilum]
MEEEVEVVEKCVEFLSSYSYESISRAIEKGEKCIKIDFKKLDLYFPEIADMLLEEPKKVIENFKKSLASLDLPSDEFEIRFFNLPETSFVKIKDLRSKHINKLIFIEGIVRQTSEVRPIASEAIYECSSCGKLIDVKLEERLMRREPQICPNCGGRRFILKFQKLVDAQRVVIEESPEMLEGGEQAKRISVLLYRDLVDPDIVKKACPGNKVRVIGIVMEVPIVMKKTGSIRYDLIIEANNLEPIQQEFEEIEISPSDVEEIKRLSSQPDIYEKFINSIAPTIVGYTEIKEAILLQLFGGVRKELPDGTTRRGDIHILLVGDPGVAKSLLLRYVAALAPKARYVTGKGTSAAGLTAAVVRDEFLRGWSLEAGALVLTNRGICVIDEIDKMGKEDREAMHEALEQQTVSISKANVQATLTAQTSVLAAANPKLGRFDPYLPIAEQIDLPPTLINRFDLIFTIRDIPEKGKDEIIAEHMLAVAKDPSEKKPAISPELMRKYIAYSKQNCKPKLTEEANEELKNFYITLRSKHATSGEEVRPIPISPRQLEALIRLAEASARVRLSDKVTREDAQRAIRLLTFCLRQVGLEPETGEIDIDRIVTGISAVQRSRIITIKNILNNLEAKYGEMISVSEVIEEAKKFGIEEERTEEILNKMKREGEIFEPKPGFIKRLPK